MLKTKLLLFLLSSMVLFGACKKNKRYPIPSVPFQVQINLSLPSYQSISAVGGWCVAPGGIKGTLIYRKSIDEFVVWERQSPTDLSNTCEQGLVPTAANFLVLDDPCSDAEFSLYDGSPIKNSDWGLRQYQYSWDGSNNLVLFN